MTLREAIAKAGEEKKAIGHFNISDIAAVRAIVRAAGDLGVPVIVGTSEGEADFIDLDVAFAMVKDMRAETGQDIFLNADHFRSLEKAKEAVRAGYDAVIFDAAKLPLRKNIENTKEAVLKLKEINPEVLVEGEVGYIGESSKILKELPAGAEISGEALPRAGEVARFVDETGVDLVAPAVGNIHGVLENAENPRLDTELIREIAAATEAPLVLHGGSGIRDEDLKAAIEAGISIVHINTEIRIAWRKGLEEGLKDKEQIAPYKVFPAAEEAVYTAVTKRLKLLGGLI